MNTNMNDIEAIKKRISRRNYLELPLEPDEIKLLEEKIKDLNESSGLTMFFLEDGSAAFESMEKTYGMFQNVRSLIVLKGPVSDKDLKEKCGYYGERLVLESTKMGLGTCWVGGTYDRENPVFKIRDKEVLVSVITVGKVESEQTPHEKKIRETVHRKTKSSEEMYESDTQVPKWFAEAMTLVQYAPSAVNSQKTKFHYRKDDVYAEIPNDSPPDLIDLGIAKLHFEIGANGIFALGNPGKFKPKL